LKDHSKLSLVALVGDHKINIKGECSMTCIKNKIKNAITAHPKLLTFGIGLAITFGVGLATGLIHSPEQAFAGGGCTSCRQ